MDLLLWQSWVMHHQPNTHSSVWKQRKSKRSQAQSIRGIAHVVDKKPDRSSGRFSWSTEDIECFCCPFYSSASLCLIYYKYLCNSSSVELHADGLHSKQGSSFCYHGLSRWGSCQRTCLEPSTIVESHKMLRLLAYISSMEEYNLFNSCKRDLLTKMD